MSTRLATAKAKQPAIAAEAFRALSSALRLLGLIGDRRAR
jgi:hypothetical protein